MAESRVEIRLLHEGFETDVHAITPVVARVRRFVDAFGIDIGQAQSVVDSEPILPREDAEHGRTVDMAAHDFFAQPSRGIGGDIAAVAEHLEEVACRTRRIFFPPSAQCGHVVRAGTAHRPTGISADIGKLTPVSFGHALNLEGEKLELIHHPGYAIGHHAQIFATGQHGGGAAECGEFGHGRGIPEVVVTLVIERMVQSLEGLTLVGIKALENVGMMPFYTGMVVIALQGVFDEEDVLKQGEQSLADLVFVGTATVLTVKEVIDSTLGGELRAEVPNVVVRMCEEGAAHPVGAFAEQAVEQDLIDKWPRQEVAIERKPCGFDLAHGIGHGRHKAPEESAHTMGGNFPNAEKA